ncbi:MAG: TolC family protein [Rhodospirillales bacterium]
MSKRAGNASPSLWTPRSGGAAQGVSESKLDGPWRKRPAVGGALALVALAGGFLAGAALAADPVKAPGMKAPGTMAAPREPVTLAPLPEIVPSAAPMNVAPAIIPPAAAPPAVVPPAVARAPAAPKPARPAKPQAQAQAAQQTPPQMQPQAAQQSAPQAGSVAVKIDPDLEICHVTGEFLLAGPPPRTIKALVYNPRNDLVYTPVNDTPDPNLVSRVIEGAPRYQVIEACNDYAAKNRGTAAAAAYQRSQSRAEVMLRAERARAAGQGVSAKDAVPAPPSMTGRPPPPPSTGDTGPSASAARLAARAAAQAPAATETQAGLADTGGLEVLLPGIISPNAVSKAADDAVNARMAPGIERAQQRSADIDAARHAITAANHEYQAAMRDKFNPDVQVEVQGGMAYGRRGPALQQGDGDTDPLTGSTSSTTNTGARGFVKPGMTLSLPVWDSGEREAKKNIAGVEVGTAGLTLDDQRAEIASIVRDTFNQWRVSRAYIGLVQQWRPMFEDWHDKIRKLQRVQMVTYQDIALARAVDEHFTQRMDAICHDLNYRESIWHQVTAENNLRLPSDKPAAWCAWPKGTPFKPDGDKTSPIDDPTLSHWPYLPLYQDNQQLDAMIEKTPTVQIAANEIKKTREQVLLAESQSLPRLFAEAHGRQTVPGIDSLHGDSDVFIGMRFTMPIFDNWVRSSKTQAQQANVASAESKLTGTRQRLKLDLGFMVSELDRLRKLQTSQVETVRAAATRVKNAKYMLEEWGCRRPGLSGTPSECTTQHELMLATLDYLRTFERSDDTIRQYFVVYNRLLRKLGVATASWQDRN